MGPTRRRPLADLIAELERAPGGFEFHQALRLLEASAPGAPALGGDSPPERERVRLRARASLGFAPAPLRRFRRAKNGERHELEVDFLSLAGADGPLPLHYTEHLIARLHLRDRSLVDFLDLFHHRALALFHRAWRKYSFPFDHLAPGPRERVDSRRVLRSLVGLGTEGLTAPDGLSLDSWLFHAAHFARPTRTGEGLRRMVQDACGLPVRLESFVGAWLELDESARSRLLAHRERPRREHLGLRLGGGFVLGSRVWDVQSKLRLHLGPLDRAAFERWRPGSAAARRLARLVRSYLGHEVDFELVLHPERAGLIPLRLGGAPGGGGLGRDTWLGDRHDERSLPSARVCMDSPSDRVRESAPAPG